MRGWEFSKEFPTPLGEGRSTRWPPPRQTRRLASRRRASRAGDEAALRRALRPSPRAAARRSAGTCSATAEDGEDALQQTFLRAHRALRAGRLPDAVRPWLFAIARNRCLTMLAARRDAAVPVEDVEPSFDGLAEDVERARRPARAGRRPRRGCPRTSAARWCCSSLGGLPARRRSRRRSVAPPGKVKALVFQARSELMAEREARSTPCESIREEARLRVAAPCGAARSGGHLSQCAPASAYRTAVATQRAGLASILGVAPALGLKAAALAAAGGKARRPPLIGGGAAGGAAGSGAAPEAAPPAARQRAARPEVAPPAARRRPAWPEAAARRRPGLAGSGAAGGSPRRAAAGAVAAGGSAVAGAAARSRRRGGRGGRRGAACDGAWRCRRGRQRAHRAGGQGRGDGRDRRRRCSGWRSRGRHTSQPAASTWPRS